MNLKSFRDLDHEMVIDVTGWVGEPKYTSESEGSEKGCKGNWEDSENGSTSAGVREGDVNIIASSSRWVVLEHSGGRGEERGLLISDSWWVLNASDWNPESSDLCCAFIPVILTHDWIRVISLGDVFDIVGLSSLQSAIPVSGEIEFPTIKVISWDNTVFSGISDIKVLLNFGIINSVWEFRIPASRVGFVGTWRVDRQKHDVSVLAQNITLCEVDKIGSAVIATVSVFVWSAPIDDSIHLVLHAHWANITTWDTTGFVVYLHVRISCILITCPWNTGGGVISTLTNAITEVIASSNARGAIELRVVGDTSGGFVSGLSVAEEH